MRRCACCTYTTFANVYMVHIHFACLRAALFLSRLTALSLREVEWEFLNTCAQFACGV